MLLPQLAVQFLSQLFRIIQLCNKPITCMQCPVLAVNRPTAATECWWHRYCIFGRPSCSYLWQK